jgi:hypothetical protein
MTNSLVSRVPRPSSSRVRLPGFAVGLLIAGPFFLVLGALLVGLNARLSYDWTIFPIVIGSVVFATGLAMVTAALVLVGTRLVAQQQVEIHLRAARDR